MTPHLSPGRDADSTAVRLAIFDLDRTLLSCDSLLTFARYVLGRRARSWRRMPGMLRACLAHAVGLGSAEAAKTSVLRLVAGAGAAERAALVASFVETLVARRVRPDVAALLAEHLAAGYHTVLLSASPDLYVVPLAARLGFRSVICTRTAADGEVIGPNCKGEGKVTALLRAFDGGRVDWARSFACGDDPSDAPVLARVGRPFAIHPTPRLRAEARARGWTIVG